MLSHLSYSAITLFLHNPSGFRKKYLLGIKEQKTTPAALVGTAFHKFLEVFYKTSNLEAAKLTASQQLKEVQDVDWGKTGSIEKAERDLERLIAAWQKDFVLDGKILFIEERFEERLKGIKIPFLGFTDMVVERAEGIVILDWKTKSSFDECLTPMHKLQGFIYRWLLEKRLKKKVVACEFVQFKGSENKDGGSQVRVLRLDFATSSAEELAAKHLIKQCIKLITKKSAIFLPNLRDEYEGETEWQRYVNEYASR